ncbi:MAG: DUF3037 domain-containing protein [Verrucomicrobiales bacterium]|nr:DUF3037 domain-containing protein [Verrucomicrobiales bacterium]
MSFEPYSFCFLRYVHDPLSGEFANVGVVLWAPESQFLGFRFSSKFRRLSRFFQDFESGDYRQLVSRVGTQFERLQQEIRSDQARLSFEKVPEHARDLALKVVPQDDNALQWSLSGGGVTESPEQELEALFQESVGRHYEADSRSRRDDAVVFRQVYSRAFEAPDVKPHIQEHRVEAPLASHKFDYAWKNGVWNVYQPLSFDLKRAEDIHEKAYRWDSRTRYLSQADEQPDIHLLLGRPTDSGLKKAYGMAKDILFDSHRIQIIEEDEASDFAVQLASEVKHAS